MSFVPDPALVTIEQNKHLPIVQGLLTFIWETCQCETKDIEHWSLGIGDSDEQSFNVRFRDNTGVMGTICSTVTGRWLVRTYRLTVTVKGNGSHT